MLDIPCGLHKNIWNVVGILVCIKPTFSSPVLTRVFDEVEIKISSLSAQF